jgi:hypothetical protein
MKPRVIVVVVVIFKGAIEVVVVKKAKIIKVIVKILKLKYKKIILMNYNFE